MEKKNFKSNKDRVLIKNADNAKILKIKINANIDNEIAVQPTTKAMGSQALTFVRWQARRINSPAIIEKKDKNTQSTVSSMVIFTLPSATMARVNAVTTNEKQTAAPF